MILKYRADLWRFCVTIGEIIIKSCPILVGDVDWSGLEQVIQSQGGGAILQQAMLNQIVIPQIWNQFLINRN